MTITNVLQFATSACRDVRNPILFCVAIFCIGSTADGVEGNDPSSNGITFFCLFCYDAIGMLVLVGRFETVITRL